MNIEVWSFSDIFVEWLSHDPIIKKRFFISCQIFMFHSIRNFENSLIISSKNVSLIFQFDVYYSNKLISFIFFIFNKSLCIERNHSRKDRKRIRYFILQFYSWANQMTALFAKGEAVLIVTFYAESLELIRNCFYHRTIIINICRSLFSRNILKNKNLLNQKLNVFIDKNSLRSCPFL